MSVVIKSRDGIMLCLDQVASGIQSWLTHCANESRINGTAVNTTYDKSVFYRQAQ